MGNDDYLDIVPDRRIVLLMTVGNTHISVSLATVEIAQKATAPVSLH
jgi:hypothetical protein